MVPCVQDGNSNSIYFTRLLRELNDLLYVKYLEECLNHSNCFSNYMMRTWIHNTVVFKLLKLWGLGLNEMPYRCLITLKKHMELNMFSLNRDREMETHVFHLSNSSQMTPWTTSRNHTTIEHSLKTRMSSSKCGIDCISVGNCGQ